MQSVGHSLNETYPAEPDSVAKARAALGDFAVAAGASRRRVDDVRLAASEAVSNSVLHAYRGEPGSIYVAAGSAAGELWILIADDGCGLQPRAAQPGLGLGLCLISQVSDELVIAPRATGGTEVRIGFKLVGAKRPPTHRAVGARRGAELGTSGQPRGSRFSA